MVSGAAGRPANRPVMWRSQGRLRSPTVRMAAGGVAPAEEITMGELSAAHLQHRRVDLRRRPERSARDRLAHGQLIATCVAGPWRPLGQPSRGGTLQHQVCAVQPVAAQQQTHHVGGERVRRARDHPERPAGKPQVAQVGGNHGEIAIGEPVPEELQPPRVQLDRDHPAPGVEQRRGQRTLARPDVEDQIAGTDAAGRDDPLCPIRSEGMPTPYAARPPRLRGHDAPSRSSNPCRQRRSRAGGGS